MRGTHAEEFRGREALSTHSYHDFIVFPNFMLVRIPWSQTQILIELHLPIATVYDRFFLDLRQSDNQNRQDLRVVGEKRNRI